MSILSYHPYFVAGRYYMRIITDDGKPPTQVEVPAPGIYGPDGGYYYRWNPNNLVLEFMKPPRRGWTAVAQRTDARKAILNALRRLPKLSQEQIRQAGLSDRPAAAPAPASPSFFTSVRDALPSLPSPAPPTAPENPLARLAGRLAFRSAVSFLLPVAIFGAVALVFVATSPRKDARR